MVSYICDGIHYLSCVHWGNCWCICMNEWIINIQYMTAWSPALAVVLTTPCACISSNKVVFNMHWGTNVRVFNPFAQSHCKSTLAQCYRKNEQEKKRAYDESVREVEHGSFSPLVFSTSGGMGPIATVVYRRLASMMAEKCDETFSQTLFWLRCRLSLSTQQ